MPGQRVGVLDWPYVEGLRLDEAMHPLTILAVGLYGKVLPNQNGAPLRLVVPWKYGFKSIKSIVRIRFTAKQPVSSWQASAPQEYGFYSNVNPDVDHPRWSQARERRIGEFFKRKTLMFNGYADQVAGLYAGMDLQEVLLTAVRGARLLKPLDLRRRHSARWRISRSGRGRARLGANPIETITHSTGALDAAVPAHHAGRDPAPPADRLERRHPRSGGCSASSRSSTVRCTCVTYVWLDQFFDWAAIVKDVAKRPFITAGFSAYVLLVPLALTSTAGMIRRLGGRTWRRLHRLVYVAAALGVVHYWWLVKADIAPAAQLRARARRAAARSPLRVAQRRGVQAASRGRSFDFAQVKMAGSSEMKITMAMTMWMRLSMLGMNRPR